jgi:hypothetical protein
MKYNFLYIINIILFIILIILIINKISNYENFNVICVGKCNNDHECSIGLKCDVEKKSCCNYV